jgi:uncharacterized coiled-coil protein SlyX
MLESSQPKTIAEIDQLKYQVAQLQALVLKQQKRLHYLEQRTNLIGSTPLLAVNNQFENWLEDLCRSSSG